MDELRNTSTRQMVDESCEVVSLSPLMNSPDLQRGFMALRDFDQLNSLFEAIVLRFSQLFSPDAVEAAKWSLKIPYSLL